MVQALTWSCKRVLRMVAAISWWWLPCCVLDLDHRGLDAVGRQFVARLVHVLGLWRRAARTRSSLPFSAVVTSWMLASMPSRASLALTLSASVPSGRPPPAGKRCLFAAACAGASVLAAGAVGDRVRRPACRGGCCRTRSVAFHLPCRPACCEAGDRACQALATTGASDFLPLPSLTVVPRSWKGTAERFI